MEISWYLIAKYILIIVEFAIGWLYASYATFHFTSHKYRSLNNKSLHDCKQWGFYWMVFALLNYLWYLTYYLPDYIMLLIQLGRVVFIIMLVIPRFNLAYKLCCAIKDNPERIHGWKRMGQGALKKNIEIGILKYMQKSKKKEEVGGAN